MRKKVLLFAVLAATLAILCTLFAGTASNVPFTYDEADYMYAGTQGFLPNYLDRNAMGLATYVGKGLELARNKTLSHNMSEYVRASGDISFYRHYHGPIYAYWIALWHAVGVQHNASYRAIGLILHALESIAIFFLFLRAFPNLSAVAALVAALMFAMNRTALLTATMITQHLAYTFLSCLALFAVALYLKSREMRYWYAAAALLAACFATVEIAVVLIGAIALSIIVLDWRDGWRRMAALAVKGTACFVAVMAILWPPGVFELNALKGYVYLAYLALARKTFTPISPRQLWAEKLKTYPLEFVLPLAMAIAALVYWRRLANRRTVTPFLVYGCLFFGVTMAITVPTPYYHGSLLMSLAVVTGVLFGEVWKRVGMPLRAVSLLAVFVPLVAMDAGDYRETVARKSEAPGIDTVVLDYLGAHPPDGRPLVVPLLMLPTLHYYYPETQIVSYDVGNLDQLTVTSSSMTSSPISSVAIFCQESACGQIEAQSGFGRVLAKEQLRTIGTEDQTWYAITANR